MEIKLFGKSLFEAKKSKIDQVMGLATQAVQESKYLPDFHGGWNNNGGVIWEIAQQPIATKIEDASKKKKVEKEEIKLLSIKTSIIFGPRPSILKAFLETKW